MIKSIVFTITIFSTVAASAPSLLHARDASSAYNIQGDPKYTVSEAVLQNAIICPQGPQQNNLVLLLPGTGENTVNFYKPNFATLLPTNNFSVCYLTPPANGLGDVQYNSELTAYAINYLSSINNAKIRIVSHSQGGLNAQWALTFFPSTRTKVTSWVAIAADYKGASSSPIVSFLDTLLNGGAWPAFIQQSAGSNMLKAFAAKGGASRTFVPTNNIYTYTDDLNQPTFPVAIATSYLPGAFNLAVQQLCPDRAPNHFFVVVDVITQFMVLQAFTSSDGMASLDTVTAQEKAQLCAQVLPRFKSVQAGVNFTLATLEVVANSAKVDGAYKTKVEPAVRDYAK